MPRYHAKISGKDYDAMADLVRKYHVIVARHTVKQPKKGGYTVDAHVNSGQIRRLKAAGYTVTAKEDVDQQGRQRRAEFKTSTRARLAAVRAAGRPTRAAEGYLGVDEVEAALAAVAAPPNAGFTQLIALPQQTWEGRTCHALKIGTGGGAGRPGLYLLGGVHAREWGSPDILINFVRQLTDAYRNHTGVTIGTKRFTAAKIAKIVETKDLFVFPQANPDGRFHSMTAVPMWRKNRRPAPAGHSGANCVGVDINRNYDFMWNFDQFFDPAAPIANSTDPCDPEVYIGSAPTSEPETKNAVWMFDTYSNVRYFIDVHSYSETILYSWGDDDNQAVNANMNFRNPAFDGKRGVAGDTVYREYMPAADAAAAVKLAKGMRDAIKAVRGRVYSVQQAVGLYPTAGTSDDYAFSRHIVNSGHAKVLSFTIEWGSESNPTPFHPPYGEMKKIIQEITGALFDFCGRAT
jgi:murein tripeptide amidase MpaA